jgi:cephalosporin hydroxylase
VRLIVDTDARTLNADGRELPLYTAEAFEVLSRQWVRAGWALQQYFTFTWMGRPVLQLPEDLVRLQEVVVHLKPDVVVETGIYDGGSLLFHASLFEAIGRGRVIGIDKFISAETRGAISSHRLGERITMFEADAVSPETAAAVRGQIRPDERVMVILDSHHAKDHVAKELLLYSPLVTPGSCIVVTDGIMRDLADVPGGEPSWTDDNPAAAAHEFVNNHPEFEMREPAWLAHRGPLRQNVTYWPDGWLWKRRV